LEHFDYPQHLLDFIVAKARDTLKKQSPVVMEAQVDPQGDGEQGNVISLYF
jgi:hypothetical protein